MILEVPCSLRTLISSQSRGSRSLPTPLQVHRLRTVAFMVFSLVTACAHPEALVSQLRRRMHAGAPQGSTRCTYLTCMKRVHELSTHQPKRPTNLLSAASHWFPDLATPLSRPAFVQQSPLHLKRGSWTLLETANAPEDGAELEVGMSGAQFTIEHSSISKWERE